MPNVSKTTSRLPIKRIAVVNHRPIFRALTRPALPGIYFIPRYSAVLECFTAAWLLLPVRHIARRSFWRRNPSTVVSSELRAENASEGDLHNINTLYIKARAYAPPFFLFHSRIVISILSFPFSTTLRRQAATLSRSSPGLSLRRGYLTNFVSRQNSWDLARDRYKMPARVMQYVIPGLFRRTDCWSATDYRRNIHDSAAVYITVARTCAHARVVYFTKICTRAAAPSPPFGFL